jgi:hypothetical protein
MTAEYLRRIEDTVFDAAFAELDFPNQEVLFIV